MDLISDLQKTVGKEHVRCGAEVSSYAIDGRVSTIAASPATAEEVGAILAVCGEHKAAVIPWGGGTSMGLGVPPTACDVAIDLRRLDQVIDHEPGDMTSTAEAGLTFARYQEHLGRHDQFLALDPPRPSQATIGGVLAANVSGPRRLRYGTARDLLIGIRVAHADGTITKAGAKVVKNVTGYDMNKLYIGSLGTLGVIVEATFRLYPRPAAERTWLGQFAAVSDAGRVIARILDSAVVPSALQLLNGRAANHLGYPAAESGCMAAVAIGSVPEAVDAQLRSTQSLAEQDGVILDGSEHADFWAAVRDYSDGSNVAIKAALPIAAVPEFIEAVQKKAAIAAVSEAGSGIVRCYVSPETFEGVELLRDVRAEAERLRGTAVVFSAPTEIKSAFDVWGPVKGLELMRGMKGQFDPGHILNPGRFVGGI